MGYRRQKLLIIKSGEGGGAITQDAFASVAGAALNTGVGKTTDTLDLVALDDATLRIMPAQEMFFVENFADGIPITEAMVSFPQLDYPLANLGLTVDGTYLRYIGYDVDGVVQVGTANFFMNQSVAHLGFVLVKVVGGVTTFLDGAAGPRNVSSSPMMASSSLLERAYATTQSNVSVIPNVGAMTFAKSAGVVRGPSINWHGGANIHELPVAGQTPASFTRINPGSAAQAILPIASTAFKCDTYWNGVASVAVPNPNNATVQRWLVGFKGGLWLQEGETVYTNLADAVDGIYNAKFSTVYPSDTYAEVARTAAIRSTTDVNNNAQSVTVQTGHVGGSGSGAAGSGPVFAEALLGVTIAPNVINASLEHLTPATGLLDIVGDTKTNNLILGNEQALWWGAKGGTNPGIGAESAGASSHISFFINANEIVKIVGNTLQSYRTINTTQNVEVEGALTVNGGPSQLYGDVYLPPKAGVAGTIRLYTGDGGISYISDVGSGGINNIQLRPNDIIAANFRQAQVEIPVDFKTGHGRVLALDMQSIPSANLTPNLHYFMTTSVVPSVVNLPPLAGNFGREYWIKNGGTSTLTVTPDGSDMIYTSSVVGTIVLNPGQWLHLVGGNVQWVEAGSSAGGGILILPASTAAFASMRVPHGVAPAAPVNGDLWTTTTGAFVQINGVTVQFGSTAGGGTDASTLTGTTLAANVVNTSINNITPAGGSLGLNGVLTIKNIDNTNAEFDAIIFQRGNGSGEQARILTRGDAANGTSTIGFAFGAIRHNFSASSLTVSGQLGVASDILGGGNVTSSKVSPFFTGNSATIGTVTYGSTGSASPVQVVVNSLNIGTFNPGGFAVNGTLGASGNLSAANFSGSSSGVNTGDQTNITGNAGTANFATSAGSAPAGTLTGATLAANVLNSSLNSITPPGGTLNIAGAISATGSITSAQYVYGQYLNMTHAANQADTDTVFYSSTDAFIRKNTAIGFRNSLNVPDRTGGGASGSWTINITGTAAAANTAASAPAGTLTGNTIASGVTTASINALNPIGGSLTVYGHIYSLTAAPNIVARGTATSQSSLVAAQASDFGTTFQVTQIQFNGSAVGGSTAGIVNAGLGALYFQNSTGGIIFTNNDVPIFMAPNGAMQMYWNSQRTFFSTYASFGSNGPRIAPPVQGAVARSLGTRFALFEDQTAGSSDYAIGIESQHVWYGSGANGGHKFYVAAVIKALLNNAGLAISDNLMQTGAYHNFDFTLGDSGFGIRNNGGAMQFKHYGGAWANFSSGGGGGGVSSVGLAGANGVTVTGSPILSSGTMTVGLGPAIDVATEYRVAGTKVVGARSAACPNLTLAVTNFNSDQSIHTTNYSQIMNQVNLLLGYLRTHGLISP